MPLLRSRKAKYALSLRQSALPIKYVVGVWLVDQTRVDLNTEQKRHEQPKNQIERRERRDSTWSAVRISLPSIEIKEGERSSTHLARQLIN